jgi:hypothetical protein
MPSIRRFRPGRMPNQSASPWKSGPLGSAILAGVPEAEQLPRARANAAVLGSGTFPPAGSTRGKWGHSTYHCKGFLTIDSRGAIGNEQ